ncbi:MAG: GTP pyrophosphokinase [Gemmatimonadales bacterium]|nr:GTP pyrophosphokinase [Gemmatimonadales bacterium]
MSTLERAIVIATRAHRAQHDKDGGPYIRHPLRLMLQMDSETERIVAVLHDVVKDTSWSLEELHSEGFRGQVLEALDALTPREDESYMDFVQRAGENNVARKVQIADLKDNMNPSRILSPTEENRRRLHRYQEALAFLEGVR